MILEFNKSEYKAKLKNVQKVLSEQASKQSIEIGKELFQAVATFDEVDIVPVYTTSGSTFSLSGNDLDKLLEEDTMLSNMLQSQKEAVQDKLSIATRNILKEAFK